MTEYATEVRVKVGDEVCNMAVLEIKYTTNGVSGHSYKVKHLCCGEVGWYPRKTLVARIRRNRDVCVACAAKERKKAGYPRKPKEMAKRDGIKGWGLFLGKMGSLYSRGNSDYQ